MTITHIAFVMYPVTDMERAASFYREVFGLRQTPAVGEAGAANQWVEFDSGGATFGIGNFEEAGTPGAAQSLALEVDDLSSFRSMLAKRGIESSEPYETSICWISAVGDPDGNRFYLNQSKAG
jgi:predicted enzyme related to lactoylglutathione lyase